MRALCCAGALSLGIGCFVAACVVPGAAFVDVPAPDIKDSPPADCAAEGGTCSFFACGRGTHREGLLSCSGPSNCCLPGPGCEEKGGECQTTCGDHKTSVSDFCPSGT